MIITSQCLWEKMIQELRHHSRLVERVAYMDGVFAGTVGSVTTITIPDAQLHERSFQVSSLAMSQAGRHFRELGLMRLAQVHTHPGDWVGHSPEDDNRAYSQEEGSVSIVIPRYALGDCSLSEVGFHLRDRNTWRRITPSEIHRHFRIMPSFLDFRENRL